MIRNKKYVRRFIEINGAVISNGKVHNEVIETVKKYLKDRKC